MIFTRDDLNQLRNEFYARADAVKRLAYNNDREKAKELYQMEIDKQNLANAGAYDRQNLANEGALETGKLYGQNAIALANVNNEAEGKRQEKALGMEKYKTDNYYNTILTGDKLKAAATILAYGVPGGDPLNNFLNSGDTTGLSVPTTQKTPNIKLVKITDKNGQEIPYAFNSDTGEAFRIQIKNQPLPPPVNPGPIVQRLSGDNINQNNNINNTKQMTIDDVANYLNRIKKDPNNPDFVKARIFFDSYFKQQ